ncbi:type IV secretory system conjugative DNA transfer family protein [Tersicoccus sp. MR15.9]|uniref:type IV secretory system conjugative DNA transfer family protein n=1 Tax=Tersicoccus mangrovi TaxID=3121635 RepID=UPI002FE5576D
MNTLRAYRMAKASSVDTNPMQFNQRTAAFAAAATTAGPATLLARRDERGLHGYLIVSEKAAVSNPQLTLAQAVGARAEAEPDLPHDLVNTPVIGRLLYHRSPVLRETQAGIDPAELPRILGSVMAEGTWVAVGLRKPRDRERSRYAKWLGYRLGVAVPTHHSMGANTVVATFTAGGRDQQDVHSLLTAIAAAMPGFDLQTRIDYPSRFHRAVAGIPLGLALAAATLFGMPALPAEVHPYVAPLTGALYAAAGILAVAGIAAAAGVLHSPLTRIRRRLMTGQAPAPAIRTGRPRPPHKESTHTVPFTRSDGSQGTRTRIVPAFDGDYPLTADTFLLGPTVIAGLVSPHAGAISGVTTTADRPTPPDVLAPIGPMIGTTADGHAHLEAAALNLGVAIVGQPNSGKSLLVRSLFGFSCLERVNPSGQPGHAGARNTLIAFESKGDGMAKYVSWASTLGDRAFPIDVTDPHTPRIDLFAVPGDNAARAAFFTNAMRYAFGESAIGDRSYETLVAVLTAGLAVTDAMIEDMELEETEALVITAGQSPLYYAHLLLGGRSDNVGIRLADGIRSLAVKLRERGTPDHALELATASLAPLYDGVTPSARRPFIEAPRNKVFALLALDSWWDPSRPAATFGQILDGHRAVVINTGSSPTGVILDDSANQQISSMLMYTLQNAIKRHCSGWLEAGRYLSIFSDELSLLAGTSPEILGWLRDQGRSFGVQPILATQRPEQLPPGLRNNLLTYATLISYAQTDPATAREVAEAVGAAWTAEDIHHLEPYTAVIRTQVTGRRQDGFVAAIPNFEADIPGYPATQGRTPMLGAA